MGENWVMASRLGPMWLNRVQQLAGPTHAGRFEPVRRCWPSGSTPSSRARAARPTPSWPSGATQLRLRARQGDSLNALLVEAFALVREAAKRTIKQRHYDVQLVGGAAIHNRCIAEMETGEGKTLVATLPAYLNALQGKGVHVVTVNDYLAQRDAEWMTPIYQLLGMTVGCIQTGQPDGDRREPPTPATSPTGPARSSASTSSATS